MVASANKFVLAIALLLYRRLDMEGKAAEFAKEIKQAKIVHNNYLQLQV